MWVGRDGRADVVEWMEGWMERRRWVGWGDGWMGGWMNAEKGRIGGWMEGWWDGGMDGGMGDREEVWREGKGGGEECR